MDKYDYHMVTTTRLRKTGPVRVKSKFKELCRLKLRHVYTVNILLQIRKLKRNNVTEKQTALNLFRLTLYHAIWTFNSHEKVVF